jgi:sugar porter (SP) family MFS transporter
MALDSFVRDFGTGNMSQRDRDNAQANIVSAFQVGSFFGALCTFPFAQKYGRKKCIMAGAAIFIVGATLMTAANGKIPMIIAGRAIGGLGIGCATMAVPVYVAETSPPSIRGRLVGIFEIFSQGGGMLGFWINYAVDQTIDSETKTQWIIPLALQLVPAVLLLIGMIFCPESPRYLAKKHDFLGCEKILCKLRELPAEHPYIQNETREIRRQIEERSAKGGFKEQLKKLWTVGTRNRILTGTFIMFLQSFTGVNVMTYYSPRIFETLGLTGTSVKLLSTGVYGVVKMSGMVLFTCWVVEHVGRRRGLLWGAALGALPLFYVGGYVKIADPAKNALDGNLQQSGWAYFAMVCIYFNAFVICATWQGVTWTYSSEIFPIDVRMVSVSLCTASTWLGSFTISQATPHMITDLGYGTFFMFGAFVVLMGLWSYFAIPETKGLTLEQMDELFSRSTSKTKFNRLIGRPPPPPYAEVTATLPREDSLSKDMGFVHSEEKV